MPVVAGAGSNDTHEGDRAVARDESGGRDAPAARLADVQQAAAARNHRALPRDRRRGRSPDRRLQRARPHGEQHRGDDDARARRASRASSASRKRPATSRRSTEILRDRPPDFSVLSGDDAMTLPIMAAGGDGVISVRQQRDAAADGAARATGARAATSPRRARLHMRLTPWIRGGVRRVEPDSREGRAGDDGQDRERAAASARAARRRDMRRPCAPRSLPSEARARVMTVSTCVAGRAHRCARGHAARARRCPTMRRTSSTQLLAALERGEVRAAERDADGAWTRGAVGEARHPARLPRRASRRDAGRGRSRRRTTRPRSSTSTRIPPRALTLRRRRAHRARRLVDPARRVSWRPASCACRRCS